jgi:hypothetical protein
MFPRPAASIALIAIAVIASTSPAAAQRPDRIRFMLPVGPSVLVPGGRFSQAYDGGAAFGATVAIPLGPRFWLRGGVEWQAYPYDRPRFFTRMGMPAADLSTQFGEYAALWSWFAGPEVTLWKTGYFEGYGLASVGGAVRRPHGFLVTMYCTPRPMTAVVNDTIRSVTYTPPPSCDEARSETNIGGVALGAQAGTGVRWRRGRSFWFLEAGAAGWLLTPMTVTLPLRAGMGWGF